VEREAAVAGLRQFFRFEPHRLVYRRGIVPVGYPLETGIERGEHAHLSLRPGRRTQVDYGETGSSTSKRAR
jgi:hypothetical protein